MAESKSPPRGGAGEAVPCEACRRRIAALLAACETLGQAELDDLGERVRRQIDRCGCLAPAPDAPPALDARPAPEAPTAPRIRVMAAEAETTPAAPRINVLDGSRPASQGREAEHADLVPEVAYELPSSARVSILLTAP